MDSLMTYRKTNLKLYYMNRFNFIPFIFLVFLCLCSCNQETKENAEATATVKELPPDKQAEVTIAPLVYTDFEHELVSNGKISARTVAEVRFQTSEVIAGVFVRNGDRVHRGDRLAALDTLRLHNKLSQAKDVLERSRLEMQDVLIGQGFRLDNPDAVPEEVMQLARIKSGFNTARTNWDMATYDLERATLTAPIGGVVANLFAKPHTLSSSSDVFCHIIDTRSLEVSFTVLENELGLIRNGDRVTVSPFSLPEVSVEGKVSEINPWVDKNGMVQIKASVAYHPRLVEGMNARVSIFQLLGKQWVVPKSAVVLRTGRQVLFTLENGKAIWHYVQTGLENAGNYTITGETLKERDQVIVSGNINLAHESPVTVIADVKEPGQTEETEQ